MTGAILASMGLLVCPCRCAVPCSHTGQGRGSEGTSSASSLRGPATRTARATPVRARSRSCACHGTAESWCEWAAILTPGIAPMRFFLLITCTVLVSVFGVPASALPPESPHIAVAANFRFALEELRTDLAVAGFRPVLSSASTGALTQQIIRGAPFDLFLAADSERPAALEAMGLTLPGSRTTYAFGRLALWAPGSELDAKILLGSAKNLRIATADPRLAPYGRAAAAVLQGLGIGNDDGLRIVTGRNVGQVFQFAASGQVHAAFVSWSQLLVWRARRGDEGSIWLIPEDLHAPIEQQAVILATSPAQQSAKRFLDFLTSPVASRKLRTLGYRPPQQAEKATSIIHQAR